MKKHRKIRRRGLTPEKLMSKSDFGHILQGIFSGAFLLLLITACTANTSLSTSSLTPTATVTVTSGSPAPGSKVAQFIMNDTINGSFNDPSTSNTQGTPPTPGAGLQAIRVFDSAGNTLATNGPSSSTWPTWISSFEVGISGSSNTSATNPNCAKFVSASEYSTAASSFNCSVGSPTSGTTTNANCAGPQGQFRVSEYDCLNGGTTALGNGGPSDGVYIRAQFNRSTNYLGSGENILVVVQYSAASVNQAAVNPTLCSSSNGGFAPEACSDFTWKTYLKHTAAEIVQPFYLLVPPFFTSALSSTQTVVQNSTTPSARQFILPLAGDAGLTYFQLSRVTFNSPANLSTYCKSNSPLCAGVVFYSITFFRI